MMDCMPMLEETKLEMNIEMTTCTMPIFKDRAVLILMVISTVFDLDSDDTVICVHNMFLNILRRYLEEHTKNEIDFEMKNIQNCITALPRVYKIFKGMNMETDKTKSLQANTF